MTIEDYISLCLSSFPLFIEMIRLTEAIYAFPAIIFRNSPLGVDQQRTTGEVDAEGRVGNVQWR